jgi:Zn-dependent peptidase ImmA (M78 family)
MSTKPDPVLLMSQSFLRNYGLDCGKRLPEIVREIGLEVVYREADSYDGALLRIRGIPRGYIVVNAAIRDDSRKRFTIAHECGHFVLPDQQDLSSPCANEKIENWSEQLYRPELEANRFAAEILMPRELVNPYLSLEPTMDSVQSIASTCGASLTASAFRLVSLTSFRAAVVWSQDKRVRWYKSSPDFARWIRKGELSDSTFAADCFQSRSVPNRLEPVPASSWLFQEGLKEEALIWEHSTPIPTYRAVLSVLVMRAPVESQDDNLDTKNFELEPREFTLNRKRWPSKR